MLTHVNKISFLLNKYFRMNFQTTLILTPIKVMIINPLIPSSQLTITKILSGIIFGRSQLVDLIFLVYANEFHAAQELAQEFIGCALPCFNTITVTSDLPCITDADVFCFMTNFANPNSFDFENMDSNDLFDTLYLIIKIAHNFSKPLPVEEPEKSPTRKAIKPPEEPRKPIIVGDGLLVIDIISIIAKNLPPEMFYSATPLRSISKTVLSDYLKVECHQLNDAYVWAANDLVFHVEIVKPYLKADIIDTETICDWEAMSPKTRELLNLEHINFSASWMKREYIEKIVEVSSNNPYGCIYRAAEMSKTMRAIWKPRYIENAKITYTSLGVISDGSLGTIKGLPYVLPLTINEKSHIVNERFEETSHLRHEIKRMNKVAVEHHQKLVSYCRKFLQENVINKAFVPACLDSESESSYNISDWSRSLSETED